MGAELRSGVRGRADHRAATGHLGPHVVPRRVASPGRSSSRRALIGCAFAAAALGGTHAADATDSPGHYEIGLSTRTFARPLFGSDQATTYRLLGSQSVPGAGRYEVGWTGGLAGVDPYFRLAGERIPLGTHALGFEIGDFRFVPPSHENAAEDPVDGPPLRGLAVHGRGRRIAWSLVGGRTRYALELPGREPTRPSVHGIEAAFDRRRGTLGGGILLVAGAPRADVATVDERSVIVRARYTRELTAWSHLVLEGFSSDRGARGWRAGAGWRALRGGLLATAYGFDDRLPYLHPLLRAGERGLELRGHVRAGDSLGVRGAVYHVAEDALRRRSELRGHISSTWSAGSHRPAWTLRYGRDDVVYTEEDGSERAWLADRLAATLDRATGHGYLGLSIEHTVRSDGSADERSQALLVFRRIVGVRGNLDGSAVVQRDRSSDLGLTAESALEYPLAGSLQGRIGIGAAWVERPSGPTGEGVARLGLSRTMRGNGWYVRVEARLPFSVGLERSRLNRSRFSLDVGNRFGWRDRRQRPGWLRTRSRESGAVAGVVRLEGRGLGGVPVLVDGEPRARTRRDGTFEARDVEAGTVFVSLDLRGLDPGHDVVGDPAPVVSVTAGATTHVELAIARFRLLQGAIVRCEDERLVAVAGREVRLRGVDVDRVVRSSVVGGFRFDRLRPGEYELTFAGQPPAEVPRTYVVDLSDDVVGAVLSPRCPGRPESSDARITPLARPDGLLDRR